MAQTVQIIPKFSFPYYETVINDYTEVSAINPVSADDNAIRYAFVFAGPKGIDNKFVMKDALESFKGTFGTSNYKKYGQPIMMPLALLENGNAKVWCMRVMPESAKYSHNIISLYTKADTAESQPVASKRKFRMKFTEKQYENLTTKAAIEDAFKAFDGEVVKVGGVNTYTDAEGYKQNQFAAIYSMGRGVYGDNYRLRVSQNTSYEKEYGIKMFNFEVLSTESGLEKVATYVGSTATSTKYETATLINDILDDTDDGEVPVKVELNEENIESIYNAYIAFCNAQYEALQDEYTSKLAEYNVPAGMLDGTVAVTDTYKDKVKELHEIKALIEASAPDVLPDLDEFDPFFAQQVASTTVLPFIYFEEALTASVDTEAEDYVAADYTSTTNLVTFSDIQGITLKSGDDGEFVTPGTKVDAEGATVQKTVSEEIDECYNKAWSGEYDKRILTPRRIFVNAFFDANYSLKVKSTLVDLALSRKDCVVYLDTGIIDTLSTANVRSLIEDYAGFSNNLVSKNLHHYLIREPGSNKRVTVTITYFLAQQYAVHMINNGTHIPFVKSYAQLVGQVKNSLAPTVEDYETDLKEILYQNRFNYFETLEDNVFQRATQSTSQEIDSDLLEESNVTTLYTMKRMIEKDVQERTYNFAEDAQRSSFRTYEKAIFADWVGSKIQSMDIEFRANAFEAEHSILHAYLSVVFRPLQKRAIIEIDINKRTYTDTVATN